MKVLAFDLATSTGVALGHAGQTPRAWSVDLGKERGHAARFSKALRMVRLLTDDFKPDLIAVEAPVGGPKTSHFLVGLSACVTGEAMNQGVRCEKFAINEIRKHFLGKHLTVKHFPHLKSHQAKAEIKRSVMNRCALLGWHVPNDDAADAAALWDYACAKHHPTTIGGMFRE